MASAARETAAGATHEESRAEGDKDTRATEQSYIARGQAMRVEALAEELARLDTAPLEALPRGAAIRAGALVALEGEGGEVRAHLVVAFGAGTELEVDGRRITVVSPSAPAGRALLGKCEGDEVELPGRGGPRTWTIARVC